MAPQIEYKNARWVSQCAENAALSHVEDGRFRESEWHCDGSTKWSIWSAVLLCLVVLTSTAGCSFRPISEHSELDADARLGAAITSIIQENCSDDFCRYSSNWGVDSVLVNEETDSATVFLKANFANQPFRHQIVSRLYESLPQRVESEYRHLNFSLVTDGRRIEELVPNYYRVADKDTMRALTASRPNRPLVSRPDWKINATRGLLGRHIALWHSHGWYYEPELDRWEWQRARVFGTVEDLLPGAFVLQYLVPMLENAGANVFLPRERDIQTNEVLVDYDLGPHGYVEIGEWIDAGPGFGLPLGSLLRNGENPFLLGSSREVETSESESASVSWIAEIPETGEYAVYVSYGKSDDNIPEARYTVTHAGGSTRFAVDQTKGAGTWIYLGTFLFAEGKSGYGVSLTNQSDFDGVVSADAVRFGGGMGTVVRNGKASGRPRYAEAARYYMQYAGMPDTLVFNVTEELNDYTDDYRSRGEWVNYLNGAPSGPNKNRDEPGLGIPIDLSLAFHTDAGATPDSSSIGTLLIYTELGADTLAQFPNGLSRMANRDFADILQTVIVDDIRSEFDPEWRRRSIWNRPYSEAFRPNVPAALLELLSHHNFYDMKFALDPVFRFHASRSIYKSILFFLGELHGFEPVVQPLPVSHMAATLADDNSVRLTWRPVVDSLEASADPTGYIVYTRINDRGFDNGQAVIGNEFTYRQLLPDSIYSFKVTAVNSGGESMPSEIVSVGLAAGSSETAIVVNAFDRVSAPGSFDLGQYAGFAYFDDEGVPDKLDFDHIGHQYEFDRNTPWADDDAPGHGASHGNLETTVFAGNTRDFSKVHGAAMLASGISFASSSDEAVEDGLVNLGDYRIVDFLLGEERTVEGQNEFVGTRFGAFSERTREALVSYLGSGGNLFISGAYIGTDLFESRDSTDSSVQFALEDLKLSWRTDHASTDGRVVATTGSIFPAGFDLEFQTGHSLDMYRVESPDGLEPVGEESSVILRYSQTNISAAIAHDGEYRVVAFGFPFETIRYQEKRNAVMSTLANFFLSDRGATE